MKDQSLELIRKKVCLYHKKKKVIHVVLLGTHKFYNGEIKEVDKDFFVVSDKKAEVPVFFSEVFKIEVYERKED